MVYLLFFLLIIFFILRMIDYGFFLSAWELICDSSGHQIKTYLTTGFASGCWNKVDLKLSTILRGIYNQYIELKDKVYLNSEHHFLYFIFIIIFLNLVFFPFLQFQ